MFAVIGFFADQVFVANTGMAYAELGEHKKAIDAFATVQGLARPHFSFDDVRTSLNKARVFQ